MPADNKQAQKRLTASDVLDVLRSNLWGDGAHAWMYELANATGGRASRYADAVVCSCWPSRGLWLAGIEVKVARHDWLRELEQPKKSAEIQRFCKYWWLATSPGVAKPEEIPETWGHVEVNGKHKVLKPAPALEVQPPTIDLVASICRNVSKGIDGIIQQRVNDRVEKERDRFNQEANKYSELALEFGNSEHILTKYRELKAAVSKFKEETGLDIDGWGAEYSIQAVKLAQQLVGYRGIRTLGKQLQEAGSILNQFAEEIREDA